MKKDEQAADKSPIFKIVHNLNGTYPSKDKPSTHVQNLVERKLDTDVKLNIKTENRKALIDFVGQIGEIMIHAATPKNIKKGFIENGMIDEETETCPDIDRMIGTLTRKLTDHESELLEVNFGSLLKMQLTQGQITDNEFDRLGFPDDIASDGSVVKRYSIHDSRKRACKLNHNYANTRRKDEVISHREILHGKELAQYHKVETIILENEKCEKKLSEKMLAQNLAGVENAKLEHFSQCTNPELKHFILVRVLQLFDTGSKQKYLKSENITKLPNKRDLGAAMRGADCLILRAYNLRMKDIILKLPEKPILDLTLCKDKWIGPMIVEVNYDNQTHTILKAEDFLKNQEWLQIAKKNC